jgi:hypothetical protein
VRVVAKPLAPVTSDTLRSLLRKRFPVASYALLEEVRNAAGFSARRSTDALAVGLWPSRGLHIHGFELKVSRSAGARARERPEKGEESAAYCDFYWVVAPQGVVPLDQIPEQWGLLEAVKGKLVETKAAVKLEPKLISRTFLAALLKRAQSCGISEDERREITEEATSRAEARAVHEVHRYESKVTELTGRIAAFEEASGVTIDGYNGRKVGEAVRLVLNGDHLRIKAMIGRTVQNFEHVAAELRKLDVMAESVDVAAAASDPVLADAAHG